MADTIKSVDVPEVHGMVALNPDGTAIGTPVGGATASNQTNGSQKTQIVDSGGEAVTVTGGKLDVNATASLAGESIPAIGATTAVAVQIVDGSGNQIASFGGGTQYTEGDTDASITGTAALVEGAANSLAVMTQPLTDTQLRAADVKITLDGETVPVTGTFWQATQPVSATDLDIRPLVNTDVVTAELSAVDNAVLDTIAAKDFATQTTLAAINAKLVTGTDIGDVTINNAAGASAVNIQDGGNTITVDGTVAVTNADITSIKTAVEIIDNAVSGNEMQVDVVGALPAGTNNIGDVDVLSVPRSLSGPGQPGTAIDSYGQVAISAVTGSNQSLIAAPGANKQIWVYGIGFTCSVAGTVAIQDEDDTAITGVVSYAQYSGPLVHPSGNFSMPLWKVATNKALEADVTTATINGWINYAIVSV